jgi:NADP-dependent alcohol dehydrogenase
VNESQFYHYSSARISPKLGANWWYPFICSPESTVMDNFSFHNPTRILFGRNQIAALAQEIAPDARVLITYGAGSVQRNGVLDQVRQALGGREVWTFGGIEPNPAYETLIEAVALAQRHQIDFLLAVGGGSVIDGTKFIAAAIGYGGDGWQMVKNGGADLHSAVPMGCVLTLPATGSEMNPSAVISRRDSQEKLEFESPLVLPKFSVLDPSVCLSLPARQTANGVVDAFVHVAEQYLTYPVDARVQDRFAEGLMLTLIEQGPLALSEPDNLAVRANIMWAATMALNGLIGAGVPQDWATHRIGHEITALYGLDHAQTLAAVMPSLLRTLASSKREKLLQFATRVWGISSGSEDQRIEGGITAMVTFFESMGVACSLSAYGLDASVVPAVVQRLEAHGMTAMGEHRQLDLVSCRRILEQAL